ncbi:MAG: ATP-binding protein [Elusimicrobiota bacterium]
MKGTRQSFYWRVFFYTIFLIFSMAALFTGISYYRRYELLKENLIDDGLLLANDLAYSSELACYAQNKKFLQSALHGLVKQRRGLTGVAIYLKGGKLLDGYWRERVSSELPPGIEEELRKTNQPLRRTVKLPGKKMIYEFYAPVISQVEEKLEINFYPETSEKDKNLPVELIGVVRLNFSAENIYKDLLKMVPEIVGLSGFFLIIGVFAAFYLSRRITQPLLQLTTMAEDLGSGKSPLQTFSFFHKDEIGILANTFLVMADRIQEREQKLAQWGEELEKMIEVRTGELKESQSRLIHAERLAAIGQLAAAVSHDLKNPLTGIQLAVVYLKKKLSAQPAEILNLLDSIGEEAEHANRIINDILIFSRPTLPVFKLVDLNRIIEESFSIAHLSGFIQGVKVVRNFYSALPEINADSSQLRRIFENLITNSCQAMSGKGEIRIETKPGAEGMAEIIITDNGPGISPENINKIFNPFFTTRAKGTGLGLTIVKGIIEMHQGAIRVESSPGEGASFVISLPIKQKEE